MIERHEISALMKGVADVTRKFVAAAVATLAARLDDFDQRLKSIPAGPQGEKGDSGERGERGEPGLSIKGDKGDPGERGGIGPVGLQGDPGLKGDKGDAGEKGETGDRGVTGDKGEPGPQGEPGPIAEKGEAGPRGEKGDPGIDGKDGRDGRDGIAKDGRDGQDGKDALQIEILSMIDPEKSYPRGTRAFYAGGEIHAMRNTAPIAQGFDKSGWEVANNGIADIVAILNDDLRTFSFRFVQTNGRTVEFNLKSPVQIQRGIFKDGHEYTRGDAVVSDNSTWTCMVESTKARPGTSPDWLLSARKGGQGRDGKDGAMGPVGKPGKDGRDFTRMGMAGQ